MRKPSIVYGSRPYSIFGRGRPRPSTLFGLRFWSRSSVTRFRERRLIEHTADAELAGEDVVELLHQLQTAEANRLAAPPGGGLTFELFVP